MSIVVFIKIEYGNIGCRQSFRRFAPDHADHADHGSKHLVNLTTLFLSAQDLPRHLPVDIGQAEVAAGVAVGETLVIESEEV